MRYVSALLGLGLLAACSDPTVYGAPPAGDGVYKSAFQVEPYVSGDVDVLTYSGRELRTYRLRACGATICGSRTGQVETGPGGVQVSGAYPGHIFVLAPGGKGTVSVGGRTRAIVWDTAE